jgi:hypothetical protein
MTGSGVIHRIGVVMADYANANPPYILVLRSVAKRCVSKDEAIEVRLLAIICRNKKAASFPKERRSLF